MKKKSKQLYICKVGLRYFDDNPTKISCLNCTCSKPHILKTKDNKSNGRCFLKSANFIHPDCICIPVPLEYYMKKIVEKENGKM